MRIVSNWMVSAAILGGSLLACGSSTSGSGTSGSSTAGSSASRGTSGKGSRSSGSSASSGSSGRASSGTGSGSGSAAGSAAPCSPKVGCPSPADAVACVGLVDNKSQTTFGLRMSELDVTKPSSLAGGVLASTIASAVETDLPACNLSGTGTFSWLLQFDTTAGTLKTGGAKPVADPTTGYSFDTDTVQGFSLAPITIATTPDASGSFGSTAGQSLVIPVFLDAAGSSVILLPLQEAVISMGTLTADQNCIGTYNAASLQPSNSCAPDATHPQFTDGGSLGGFITLKDANNVMIASLNESLCALLAGGSDTTTMQGSGATVCATDASANVVYQGDWCSTMNGAATAGCADAVAFQASFAASSVTIH